MTAKLLNCKLDQMNELVVVRCGFVQHQFFRGNTVLLIASRIIDNTFLITQSFFGSCFWPASVGAASNKVSYMEGKPFFSIFYSSAVSAMY